MKGTSLEGAGLEGQNLDETGLERFVRGARAENLNPVTGWGPLVRSRPKLSRNQAENGIRKANL